MTTKKNNLFIDIKSGSPDHNDKVYMKYSQYEQNHSGDSGIDLYCLDNQVIPANSFGNVINLQVQIEMYKKRNVHNLDNSFTSKRVPSSFWLLPRSSLAKTPLRLSNSLGLIDSSYRGNIMAKVDNFSNEKYEVKEGSRLFQITTPDLMSEPTNFYICMNVVDDLSVTSRGDGGFGSTNN